MVSLPLAVAVLSFLLDSAPLQGSQPTQAMWVELSAKDLPSRTIVASDTVLTERALTRRAAHRTLSGLFDVRDLPIAESRVRAIVATGATVRTQSRWLNVEANDAEILAISHLPFVQSITPLHHSRPLPSAEEIPLASEAGVAAYDYGLTGPQLLQIDVPSMHMRGFHGQGIVIGILDTGFNRVHEAFHSVEHPLDVIAEWDFVSNDANTAIEDGDDPNQHKHGTWILGTMAAFLPGSAIGAAYQAQFVLAKTEVYATETIIEEDYYVAGLEFIEAQGADLATSSLGYIDWYTPAMLDGLTAITTRGVNIATANGLVCLTAAGNAGHDADTATWSMIAPADALDVISCGAANEDGSTAGFSSDGPSADGRVKPEVLARGVAVVSVNSTQTTGLSAVSGTSLSTPLIAGATALLMQSRSDLGVGGVRGALFSTASDFVANGTTDPLFVRGYGVISALDAARTNRVDADLNLDGIVDAADLASMLASWGPCTMPDPATGFCIADIDSDGVVSGSDLGIILGSWGL
ncbi:MAG: S8 family serine peptidase [Planctomycetota bacterium]|nr:S8 family serine peptidase [Planctomycetota bacterium]